MDSPVICYESEPPEDHGRVLHTTVAIVSYCHFLPPLTLLEVVNVQEPGTWEYLPGKQINQKCITVRPTYLIPAKLAEGETDGVENKFAGDRTFISYGNTQDAVRGTLRISLLIQC
jgi:hypothetical protein